MGFDLVAVVKDQIAQLDDDTAIAIVDVTSEVLRMIRENDTETSDPRAREFYNELFTKD